MSDLKIQGVVEMSSTGAEQALDRIGDKAGQMAADVAREADKAGKAVDGIGNGAARSADEFSRAEGKIVASIKRAQSQLENFGKTASQRLELKINERGLDASKFEPMLAKLRELEAAQNRIGASGRSFGSGLQNTSYQMQDFIVQVNGGVDATRALSMQLPQMLVGFGAAGAAIGVLAALLPNLIAAFGDAGAGAKSFQDALSDFDSSLSDVGRTVKSFDMDKLYEQFNSSSVAVRAATIEQVKFQRAFIETQRLTAQKAFGESLGGLGEYSTANRLAGAFGATGAEKLADQLGLSLDVAKDLLPVLKGLRDGSQDVGAAFTRFGTSLLSGNQKAVELAQSLSKLASSEKDAYAASSALSEAQAKMAAGHVTTKKEADAASKSTKSYADEAAKAVAAGRELAASLIAQASGLSGDFAEKWDSIALAYKSGAISATELTQAQAQLLSQQPAIKANADEQRKAVEDYAKSVAASIGPLEARALQLESELATYGQTEAQIAATTVARYEEVRALAAANGASPEYLANLDREIEARKRIAAALGDKEARDTTKKAAADAAREWERTADTIEKSLTDALMRGFENGEEFGENLRATLINMFKTLVLRPIIQPIAQGMSGFVTNAMGISGGGAGGGGMGGLSNLYSMGSSLYNYGSLGYQYAAGTMSGANALGTMYANATGTGLDGLVGATGGWGTAPYSPGMGTYGAGLAGAMWAYNQTGSYTAGVAGGAAGMAGAGAIAGGMGAAAAGTSVGAGAMAGASAGLAAIPVWGWAALAVMAIAADLMQDKKDPRVAFQMAKKGGANDRAWEDGIKVSSVFGELGLNANSKDVDAKDYKKSLEAMAAFDAAMAAFLSEREIDAIKERMDGWKSTRVSAKYAAAGQRERMLAIAEGIGGDVFADAQAFVDSGQAKGNKGVQAFTQFVLDRVRTDELSEFVGQLGGSLSEDDAMAWMQSRNRTETVRDAKGKKQKVQISGFDEIVAASQSLQAAVGRDAGEAMADQVKIVADQFDAMSLAMPTSIDGLKSLIAGLDLTTEAGRDLYMTLGPLAQEFAKVEAAQEQLYDMLVPESEKFSNAQARLAGQFAELGVAMPSSIDGLRALIDAQDESTEAGREMRAELLALVPAFVGVRGVIDQMLSSLMQSIANARAQVEQARAGISGPQTMRLDEIRGQFAGIVPDAPDSSAVQSANDALSAAVDALSAAELVQASATADASAALSELEYQYSLARQAVELVNGIDNAAGLRYVNTAGDRATISFDEDSKRVLSDFTGLAGNTRTETAKFNELYYGVDAGYSKDFESQYRVDDMTVAAAFEGANERIAAAESAYGVASTAQSDAEAVVSATSADKTAAEEAAAAAQSEYSEAIRDYIVDAGKAVAQLNKLREETVSYYEAQKALADLMLTSSARLREAVKQSSVGQMDEIGRLAQMRQDFDQAYTLALSTSDAVQAGYADTMSAQLPELVAALQDSAGSREEWQRSTRTLYAQSEAIAAELEATSPQDYEAESLDLLADIDTMLGTISDVTASAEKIIADAIYETGDQNLDGLRAVVAAIEGEAVPAFASGGYHAGGVRLVGEQGPELEVTGPSRIWSASQTRALLGGGSNDALVAEVRALRSEVASLRAATETTARATHATNKTLDRVTRGGDAMLTEVVA